jgi:hypothetical protein
VPETARQVVLQALKRAIVHAATDESEVAND